MLALPPEIRLQPTIPSGLQGRFSFPVTEPRLALVLLRPPERAVVETASAPITVPRGARFHFAYGLTEAAAVRAAGRPRGRAERLTAGQRIYFHSGVS